MKIRLSEIPAEGRTYTYSRETGELNGVLEDLIEQHPYEVELFIKPMGNAYEMRGHVNTEVTEICSKCGWDFELPMKRKFHEILIEDQEDHRKNHSVHGNHSVDFLGEGPSMVTYRGEVFDAGDYVHESVALEEPFYPTCGPNGTCLHQAEVAAIVEKLEKESAAAEIKSEGHPAFAVLKGLELESKA